MTNQHRHGSANRLHILDIGAENQNVSVAIGTHVYTHVYVHIYAYAYAHVYVTGTGPDRQDQGVV